MRTAVLALGGNALARAGEPATVANQFRHARESVEPIVELAREGWGIAIVHGKLKEASGTFRSFLAEDRDLRVKTVGGTEGKEAITHYRTIASGRRFSILEVTIETGRRNQIRVHLAEAGHPVVGDTMYGKGRDESLTRLGLHAKHLGFTHPRTRERVRFTSEPPREFRELSL